MKRLLFPILVLSIFISACTTYKTQYAGFRPPEDYANTQRLGEATIGAEAYPDKQTAKVAFGFDIKGAGLLPVQMVMNNPGSASYEVVTSQTFLVDQTNRYWQLIPNKVAVERVEAATETGAIAKGAGKKAMFGAAGGAILGAALGIVTGQNVAEAAGKGAVIGGAGGALIGGTQEGTSKEREYRISDDLREKGIEGKIIPPASLANGFLFFPAEANSAKELRVQLKEKGTGRAHLLILPFYAQ
ncbi:MAG: glycine zipper family protein [Desulfobulbaceae bacterium]|uniref:Glycine zipper family protein n=1 Tax=Candidatus Desulfobia pelagia TaxID=2841692 RepID=A0A8J6NE75_9BACT|nr:glycine zipper family protein [Candidatus Desulfobia pelagia]